MAKITELGYLGFGVKNIEEWKRFASDIGGLEVVDGEVPGRCYLRMDYWHHRIVLDEDGTDDLSFVGLRVAGVEEFREMRERLEAAGVNIHIGTPEEAEERHVLELMKLEDPSGNPLEIFHGPHIEPGKPFYPGRRLHGGFLTGEGGLGHLFLRDTVGLEEMYQFYTMLGMRGGIEYKMRALGVDLELAFMHCNSRDHTIAFGNFPDAGGVSKRIQHLMLEYKEFDDLCDAHEIVKQATLPIPIDLGKHSNDKMYSFYCVNPSGWMSEFGWGGAPSTHQSEFFTAELTGRGEVEG